MKMVVLSVKDEKAGMFARPFVLQSVAVAIRSFQDEVNRKDDNNLMYSHPNDFALFQVGEFDEVSGALISVLPPKLLVEARQVRIYEAVVSPLVNGAEVKGSAVHVS